MLIYEVNLDVEPEIATRYRDWLDRHIREMLGIEGFVSAELFLRRPEDDRSDSPSPVGFTVHYRVEDRVALERYFANEAPRMRGEGLRLFGNRFAASRRILETT
jgi:hypothetical protein